MSERKRTVWTVRAAALMVLIASSAAAAGAQEVFGPDSATPGTALNGAETQALVERGLSDISEYSRTHELRSFGNRAVDLYTESDIYIYSDAEMNGLFSANDTAFFAARLADGNGLLIDSDGDGLPDSECRTLFAPYWTVAARSTVDPDDRRFLNDLDAMFAAYTSDSAPQDAIQYTAAISRMVGAIASSGYPNRDLYYLLYVQTKSHSGDGEWTMYALRTMSEQIDSRFGYQGVHPTILIYVLEHYIKNGDPDDARRIDRLALQLYPDNPVFRLYQYSLDSATADQIPAELRSHWMYAQMFR